ncbi:MAG: transcription antitermination factor NusB [Ignavibacteriae bacterium]|nr:MAG: transcription antitermination factor NusB [Ignavibacteriota bacterium]
MADQEQENDKKFPVSKTKSIKGSRHLAREKVLQVIAATVEGEVSLDDVFPHVFYRQFTFEPEGLADDSGRILRPDEVFELEADVPIEWSKDDVEYAVRVVEAVRNNRDRTRELIDKHSKNWDVERIALLDRVLIQLAIGELVACMDIPVKVTINEVIELAKRYSTDKSGIFINGMLDAITADLKNEGLVRKTGRGLIE